MTQPIIGVVCCARMIDNDSDLHHIVFRSYIDYIKNDLKAIPILIPAIITRNDDDLARKILNSVDGIFLPGSPSNVSLRRVISDRPFSFDSVNTVGSKDLNRDMTVMKILEHAYHLDKPVLGVCRGLQEINIFFGGDLYPELHCITGKIDHRSDKSKPLESRYDVSHRVSIEDNSLMGELINKTAINRSELFVNSLHSQGISKLGRDLLVECRASDNTIEAIRHAEASFIYGVQWHTEWLKSPLDKVIADAFIMECSKNA
ncbi:gamma-glutamyl-gamma-aminobutyrate hydrolase family protein [Serratia oryzae]|uniref:gamma-glutamyl-gamma-aminobutyrate hydrolase family protein n=1 Tax=Serratia oryzae TaxID=2034155 RepID=UPI0009782FB5|nr:gamma-glutamyl-gamma-aminobutyrate hydrolase family protein [Serratia oryzae]